MRFYAPNDFQYRDLQKHQYHNVQLHTVLEVTNEGDRGKVILTCKDHNSILLEILQPEKGGEPDGNSL